MPKRKPQIPHQISNPTKKQEQDQQQQQQSSINSCFNTSKPNSTFIPTTKTRTQQQQQRRKSSPSFRIFCDLDGVLCDFDTGVRTLFDGKHPDDIHPIDQLWSAIAKADSFYLNLPWMIDGRELWNAILPLKPDILTGVPHSNKAKLQKADWCRRELGVEINHVDKADCKRHHRVVTGMEMEDVVNVITCWSRNKHFESGKRAVLIDDRLKLKQKWEGKGGIFIHHTSTETTLKMLRQKEILNVD